MEGCEKSHFIIVSLIILISLSIFFFMYFEISYLSLISLELLYLPGDFLLLILWQLLLFLTMIFTLKLILSDHNIVALPLFWLIFAWFIIFTFFRHQSFCIFIVFFL